MLNKRFIILLSVAALFLLLPLVTMPFTTEVNWSIFDFIVAGGLLFGSAVLCELLMRKTSSILFRRFICLSILLILLLIWIELAVGIF